MNEKIYEFNAVIKKVEGIDGCLLYTSNVGLRFNQNYKLSKYTHLQLSEKTHGEIRTEVSI